MPWRLLLHVPLGAFRRLKGRAIWLGLGLVACLAGTGGMARAFSLSDRVVQADDYFLGRQNPENVAKGLELLRADVAVNVADFEAWWRISKFLHYQARHAPPPDKLKLLEGGIDAANRAIALEPN